MLALPPTATVTASLTCTSQLPSAVDELQVTVPPPESPISSSSCDTKDPLVTVTDLSSPSSSSSSPLSITAPRGAHKRRRRLDPVLGNDDSELLALQPTRLRASNAKTSRKITDCIETAQMDSDEILPGHHFGPLPCLMIPTMNKRTKKWIIPSLPGSNSEAAFLKVKEINKFKGHGLFANVDLPMGVVFPLGGRRAKPPSVTPLTHKPPKYHWFGHRLGNWPGINIYEPGHFAFAHCINEPDATHTANCLLLSLRSSMTKCFEPWLLVVQPVTKDTELTVHYGNDYVDQRNYIVGYPAPEDYYTLIKDKLRATVEELDKDSCPYFIFDSSLVSVHR
jgi:hypothetical protein